ncbi:MAG: hypothetical protein WBX49_08755 [Candidatus Deferrimicrobiaceae bacterium]
MRITKTRSTFTIDASPFDFFFGRIIPSVKEVVFDRTWGEVTVRPRLFSKAEQAIPYRQILKIRHQINAPIIRTGLDGGGYTYFRSVSAVSEVLLELRDASTVPIYADLYDQGGNSMIIREKIREVQKLVDEIARITEKPMVIDFQEVECTFDMAERKIMFSGMMLPKNLHGSFLRFEQIERIEVVETPRGYFSFSIVPRWGTGITTTEGYDTTNFLSDTVKMIAKRSDLFFLRVERKPPSMDISRVPNVPIKPRIHGKSQSLSQRKTFDFSTVLARFRR